MDSSVDTQNFENISLHLAFQEPHFGQIYCSIFKKLTNVSPGITAREHCFFPGTSRGYISIRMTLLMGLSEGRAYLWNILSRARFIKEILFCVLKIVGLGVMLAYRWRNTVIIRTTRNWYGTFMTQDSAHDKSFK